MKLIKYVTKNLCCYKCCDKLGQEHYQIYERENDKTPVAIYVDKNNMMLSDDIPTPERQYKYFDEMCEIVQTLMELEMENQGIFQ